MPLSTCVSREENLSALKSQEIPPGKTVSVEVLRGQKRVRLSIKASVRPLGSLEKESLPPAYDEESAPEDAPEH